MDENKPKEKSTNSSNSRIKTVFGKKDNQAKLFFLVLAIFLWVLLKLSKEEGFVQTVNFPVVYQNFPEKLELKNVPPDQISIKLKASGFNLLKYNFKTFKPIKLNVNQLNTVGKGSSTYWIPNNQRSFIENQLEKGIEVLSISPDTIEFNYIKLQTKRVPVVLKVQKNFEGVSSLYSLPTVTPDSIDVIGSSKKLKQIDSVVTESFTITDEEDTINQWVPLKLPNIEGVSTSHKKVRVNARIAKLTERVLERQIEILNVPDSLEIVIFPKSVKMQLQLAMDDFDKIIPIEVIPFVDYNDLVRTNPEASLKIKYEKLPSFVRQVTLEPRRVEFILTKK